MAIQNVQGGPPLDLGGGVYPLTVSADGRWIERADAAPFNINGDTPWSIEVNISAADVTTYLEDRAAKGVNVVMFSLIEHAFSDNSPEWRNENGDLPFTGTLGGGEPDFNTPNEDYWEHVDFVIEEAHRLGITCIVLPAYVGYEHGAQGWASVINANGNTKCGQYGTFLGNRYKDVPNIIWAMGGDGNAVFGGSDLTSEINALANAIKAEDTNHLMTAHPAPGNSAYDVYNQTWLDINAAYPDGNVNVHKEVRAARQQVAKPTFMLEAWYGNEHSMTDLNLRTQMYQSVLGGGVGHLYGSAPVWYFGVDSGASADAFADTGGLDWHDQLNAFGASFLTYVKRLQDARNLSALSPDYAHTKVTAGYDTGGAEGVTYCPVMASDQVLVAYNRQGSGSGLTVNKATFVSATFNVNWYNPRTGTTTSGGTAAFGSGTQVFTAPDTNDWVLLLDDQALSLSNP